MFFATLWYMYEMRWFCLLGSTQDTDRLRGLFTSDSLRDYYDVMEERNITKLRLIRLLQLVRSETQRRKYCALFLFILTHGEKVLIYC